MAFWEEVTKGVGGGLVPTVLVGVAVVVVSPIVVPALLMGLRPVVKTVIKGSLLLTDKVRQLATEMSEQWSDPVAEARGAARPITGLGVAGTVAVQSQQTDEADLQDLTGIGSRFAELLRAAGVESVRELARRNPANLHEKLIEVNEQQQVVSQVPSLELVTDWITQAKQA